MLNGCVVLIGTANIVVCVKFDEDGRLPFEYTNADNVVGRALPVCWDNDTGRATVCELLFDDVRFWLRRLGNGCVNKAILAVCWFITGDETVGTADGVAGVCVPLAVGDKLWLEKFDEDTTGNKIPIVCWIIVGGRAVIPEFDETLIVVALPTIPPGKVVAVMLTITDEFNEIVLFNNADVFNWFNWVVLIKLINVEFNRLDAVVFWNEPVLLLTLDMDIMLIVVVVFVNEPKLTELNKLEEVIVLFGGNDEFRFIVVFDNIGSSARTTSIIGVVELFKSEFTGKFSPSPST